MDARIDPPSHTEYLRSGGAIIFIFTLDGTSDVISFCILSSMPGKIVVPPDNNVLAYKFFLRLMSHFLIDL